MDKVKIRKEIKKLDREIKYRFGLFNYIYKNLQIPKGVVSILDEILPDNNLIRRRNKLLDKIGYKPKITQTNSKGELPDLDATKEGLELFEK